MDHADSEAVLRNFERTFGVHTPRALAERLLADSQGFPQHLNSALRSLGEEWLRAGGRGDGLDAAAVSEKARARREAYYEGRLGGSFGRNTRIAAAAADLAGRGDMVQEGLIEMLVSSFVETLGWAPQPCHRPGGGGLFSARSCVVASSRQTPTGSTARRSRRS